MVINGWTIYAHPLFLDQVTRLHAAVARDRAKDPANYQTKANAKLLHAIRIIAQQRIPQDPTDKRYRLGGTLGRDHKHWFRDKFGNGRFRLFFRFDAKAKIIIYAWVNVSNPPDGWDKLVTACQAPTISELTETILKTEE